MGPLAGLKIIEIESIGPGPFCGMMLADMGAEVIRVVRNAESVAKSAQSPVMLRGRRSVVLDLKSTEGKETLLQLCESADALIEGFRPGVMERLGLGPEICLGRNPRLVFGRMTGWGQEGPLAQAAGHDINYIALSGALHACGRAGQGPQAPLNLVGDFGGGAMMLAFGIVCALLETQRSGQGQVVDAAMVDGSALLMAMFHDFKHRGQFTHERGKHFIASGAHFYDCYETADGEHISIGAIEPQFYQLLINKAGLDPEQFADYGLGGKAFDPQHYDRLKEILRTVFKQKTQARWVEIMEGSDVCFAPVLSIWDAPNHPHNVARQTFVEIDGTVQPAPAPRFSRTPASVKQGLQGQHSDSTDLLAEWGKACRAEADTAPRHMRCDYSGLFEQ
ncbi:MAG: CaiB/BaiF CoA-transferase family protein [Motiliproteus sp.]